MNLIIPVTPAPALIPVMAGRPSSAAHCVTTTVMIPTAMAVIRWIFSTKPYCNCMGSHHVFVAFASQIQIVNKTL